MHLTLPIIYITFYPSVSFIRSLNRPYTAMPYVIMAICTNVESNTNITVFCFFCNVVSSKLAPSLNCRLRISKGAGQRGDTPREPRFYRRKKNTKMKLINFRGMFLVRTIM